MTVNGSRASFSFSFLFLSLLYFSSIFCSQQYLKSDDIKVLKERISLEFRTTLLAAIEWDDSLESFRTIISDIDRLFLSSVQVPDTVYDRIVEFFDSEIEALGMSSEYCVQLSKLLAEACNESKKNFYFEIERIALNKKIIKISGDICQLFVPHVKWLIGTSKALGVEGLFRKTSVLLDAIRTFLSNIDPNAELDTNDIISFIRNSWECSLTYSFKPSNEIEAAAFAYLQPIFTAKLNSIFMRLSNEPILSFASDFQENQSFQIDFDGYFITINDDLWGYIVGRIEKYCEQIENDHVSSFNIYLGDASLVDYILMDFSSSRHQLFSLKLVTQIIIGNFADYAESLKQKCINSSSSDCFSDENSPIDNDCSINEIIAIREAINSSMDSFTNDLKIKIAEIRSIFQLEESKISDDELSIMAISELAREFLFV